MTVAAPGHERTPADAVPATPREDRGVLIDPPADTLAARAADNAGRLDVGYDVQGRPLDRLRAWTRETVLASAREYTAGLGVDVPGASAGPLLVGGHQPELFHPGVWAKNFAFGNAAARAGGTGLNLVIDSDLMATVRVPVPAGDRANPRVRTVPFDADRAPRPWSEAHVRDRRLFETFGVRAADELSRYGLRPLAADHWCGVVGRSACESPRLFDRLTAFRRRIEGAWGLHNLEVPIGTACESDPFLWFAAHLMAHARRLRSAHNAALAAYRAANGLRSDSRPVPDLTAEGDETEVPFWLWTADDPVRRRTFVRRVDPGRMELRAGEFRREFPLSRGGDACCAVEVLRELAGEGVRLRTRALATTLFARLCLADLFVHGIGGSKYDEVTDGLIVRFFGLEPPAFGTVSATAYLPFAEPFGVDPADAARLSRDLRDLHHNPQRHLPDRDDPEVAALLSERNALLAEQTAADARDGLSRRERAAVRPENRTRFERLHAIDAALRPRVSDRRAVAADALARVDRRTRANALLRSREWSFCLFPEEVLRPFLTGL